MKALDEIIANVKHEREHVYGDPDTKKYTALDVAEYECTAAGIDTYHD